MINDVASHSKLHSKIFLFADDIAIWIRWKSLALSCKKKLHNDIRLVEQWAIDWGFKLSGNKSKFIIFSRKKRIGIVIVVNGTSLKPSSEVSFFGVIFDKGLTWTPRVKMLTGKCAKRINLVRHCLSGTEWGTHRDSLLLESYYSFSGLWWLGPCGYVHEQSKKNWRLSSLKPAVCV